MKKYKHKVSVCVPVYNTSKYLEECIESLLRQTLKDIELIFVNDGSTDNSLEILNRYASKHRNIVVIDQDNQGLGGARNSGIKAASGEYIGFIDSDDTIDEHMFEKLLNLMMAKKAEITMCNLKVVPTGAKKNIWYTPYRGKIDAAFLHHNTQPTNKLVSRKLIDRINFRFFEKNGDGMFIILMLHAKNIASIDEKLYFYRVGHSSMSTSYNIESFLISIRSCQEQNRLFDMSPYRMDGRLREYFEFRMIYILIQTIAVASYLGEIEYFKKYASMLLSMNYKNNTYMKQILKKEFNSLKYFGITQILPLNYFVSRTMTRFIL